METNVKHLDTKLEAFRAEITGLIRAMQEEIKDFHARLCKIQEDRNKK